MVNISEVLSGIPATVYVGFFTASTTLIGVFITNEANNKRLKIQYDFEKKVKQQDLMREKLEELYCLSSRFIHIISSTYISWGYYIKGVTDLSDVLKSANEISKNNVFNQEKILMLIKFYFPTLETYYKDFEESQQKINEIWLDITSENSKYKKNYNNQEILSHFSKRLEIFELQSDKFLASIVNEANKYLKQDSSHINPV